MEWPETLKRVWQRACGALLRSRNSESSGVAGGQFGYRLRISQRRRNSRQSPNCRRHVGARRGSFWRGFESKEVEQKSPLAWDHLPIEEILAESKREESIRKGCISTLRLWCSVRMTHTKNGICGGCSTYMGGTIIIIRAEGVPPGKMIVFITMRIAGAICPRARTFQPNPGSLRQFPGFGTRSGSLLAGKPGSFLASAEASAIALMRRGGCYTAETCKRGGGLPGA